MFCPNCGSEMNEGALFCGNCGFKNELKNVNSKKKKGLPIKLIIFIVVILGLGLFVANNIFTNNSFESVKLVGDYDENVTIDQMDTVLFGLYPQNDTTVNANEEIEWIVLDRDIKKKKVLLLSKYILDSQPFSNDLYDSWSDSQLRKWLNEYFYNKAFNDNQKRKILNTNVRTNIDMNNETGGFIETEDTIFLLSVDEILLYFGEKGKEEEYNAYQTIKDASARGTKKIVDYYKEKHKKAILDNKIDISYNSKFTYWLRSPGEDFYISASVSSDSNIMLFAPGKTSSLGVRPALWVSYENNEELLFVNTVKELCENIIYSIKNIFNH